MVRRQCGVADRVMGPLRASNVWSFSFPNGIEEGLNMAKETAMIAVAKSDKSLYLTAIYFSANAAATAVSGDLSGLESRTTVLPRNRERESK